MRNSITVLILLSIIVFFACRKKEVAKTSGSTSKTAPIITSVNSPVAKDTIEPTKKAIIAPDADLMNTGAYYTVDTIFIKGDTLSVLINYSGGCKDHSFELYTNGNYAKSLPPQLSLCLRHTNNGDGCRKLIMQELKFNINNLKYPGKNTVVLKLGEKHRVTYLSK